MGFRSNVLGKLGVLAVVGMASLASSAQAAVVISNLNDGSNSVTGFDPFHGQGVLAGTTVNVNSITLPLQSDEISGSNTVRVLIRDGLGNASNVLYTLGTATIPGGVALTNYTFAAPANTTLTAGTTYYIALANIAGTGYAPVSWDTNTSGGTGVAGWSIIGGTAVTNPANARYKLAIDATAVVPEPGTAMLGVAGVALLVRRRRQTV